MDEMYRFILGESVSNHRGYEDDDYFNNLDDDILFDDYDVEVRR